MPRTPNVTLEMLRERVHPEDRAMRDEAIKRALAGAAAYDLQYRVLLPEGAECWIASRGHVEFDPAGKPVLSLGSSWMPPNANSQRSKSSDSARNCCM